MPLYVNSTLIPENQAQALTVNGSDITNIWMNGVQAWTQQLNIAAIWSGNSFAVNPSNFSYGIQTSGSLFRYYFAGNVGAWLSAYTDGTFQSGSSIYTYVFNGTHNYGYYAGGSGGTLVNQILYYQDAPAASAVSYTVGSGFSGTSVISTTGLETSGGLLRALNVNSTPGAWISLT